MNCESLYRMLLYPAALLLLCAACSPRGEPEPDPAELGDPIEELGEWSGNDFAELLEMEAWRERKLLVFCSGVQGVNVYSYEDPENLELKDRTGFTGASTSYPRCQRLTIDKERDFIFVANHGDEVQPQPFISVIDAQRASNLRPLTVVERPEPIEGLWAEGDYLYAAAHEAGLLVFEIADDGGLTERAGLPLTNAWNLEAAGGIAYVADGHGGMAVVDIADPSAPALITTLELPGAVKDLVIDGDRIFAALGEGGVGLISIDSPRAPTLIEVEDTPGSVVAVDYGGGPQKAVLVSDWTDLRVFSADDRNDLVQRGREPLFLRDGVTSRSFGVAAHEDLLFSSNWSAMKSYRFYPEREAPDLYTARWFVQMPDSENGVSSDLLVLRNEGDRELNIRRIGGSSELSLEGMPDTMQPGERVEVTLRYDGPDSLWRGDIRIRSNDPDQNPVKIDVEINVQGTSVGDAVPDWEYLSLTGEVIELSNLRGNTVLLAYFNTF